MDDRYSERSERFIDHSVATGTAWFAVVSTCTGYSSDVRRFRRFAFHRPTGTDAVLRHMTYGFTV